ncbi:SRPBCC domain-containing protein [Actinoplanes sp. KI2]|uniref:SRPBCC domain-containing protein n=1 Tax=Actinoplanes sp. KI2 TaxID=2983315 RepID=UPI0021D5E055|nr:SRPBCC domain-containing protein [Actinoplanes sp. KI2]MCU7728834.1 SRPBCC domain-containing protein [Actinoplanes sp. KI2]
MRLVLQTEINIAAPPEDAWRHLVDLAAYRAWNPFVTEAAGKVAVGERLTIRVQAGDRASTLHPTITVADPGRVFEWVGHLGMPGLFSGRHRFELTPDGTGCRLVHSETFHGLLVRPLRRSLETSTRAGFEAMNDALAHRVLVQRAA